MCGEKRSDSSVRKIYLGSPPHVRGKGGKRQSGSEGLGITPACAGKRSEQGSVHSSREDHPRMCGEKFFAIWYVNHHMGSPPHVRGKDTI